MRMSRSRGDHPAPGVTDSNPLIDVIIGKCRGFSTGASEKVRKNPGNLRVQSSGGCGGGGGGEEDVLEEGLGVVGGVAGDAPGGGAEQAAGEVDRGEEDAAFSEVEALENALVARRVE